MHVGWSLLVGIALFGATRRRWRAGPAAAPHPALMTVTVVGTGNHYLLDAVAGAAIALFSLALVRRHASRGQAQPSRRALPSALVQAVRRTGPRGATPRAPVRPAWSSASTSPRRRSRRRPCNCTTRTSQPAARAPTGNRCTGGPPPPARSGLGQRWTACRTIRGVRFLIVQHDDDTPLGSLGEPFQPPARSTTGCRSTRPEPPAPVEAYSALVVLGGVTHPDQDEEFPWLLPEVDAIRTALEHRTPTLGVCLGGQLVARAAGG